MQQIRLSQGGFDYFRQGAFDRLAITIGGLAWIWIIYAVQSNQLHEVGAITLIALLFITAWLILRWHKKYYLGAVFSFLIGQVLFITLVCWWLRSLLPGYLGISVVVASSLLLTPLAGAVTALLLALVLGGITWLDPALMGQSAHYYQQLAQYGLVVVLVHQAGAGLRDALDSAEVSAIEATRLVQETRLHRAELQRVLRSLDLSNHLLQRTNTELFYAREIADKALQFKSEFAAQISHELRTSLNLILGYSETIAFAQHAYGVKLPNAYLRDVTEIHRNSRHLMALIDDILDLSKLEAGRLGLHRENGDLQSVVTEAVEIVHPLALAKHLELRVLLPAQLPVLSFDRARVRQVLLNLLSNAVRITKTGHIEIRAGVLDEEVSVSVHDTGPGIAPADQEYIFEEFRQLDQTGGATGLGLAVSRRIIQFHGGRMWVNSEVGVGSTFVFTLPRTAEMPLSVTHHEPVLANRRAQPGIVVLGAKDSDEVRLLIRHLEGFTIIPAETLEDARLQIAQSSARALILTQPVDDDALDAIPIPVLICPLPGPSQTSRSLGISTYLQKPVTIESVQAALRRVASDATSVLIVDNEPSAVRMIERMVQVNGKSYRIFRAYSGHEAIARAIGQPPDVIFLDLRMADGDGYSVVTELRAHPTTSHIPIIVVSGTAVEEIWQGKSMELIQPSGLSPTELLDYMTALLSAIPPARFSHRTSVQPLSTTRPASLV
jgi:signal transduction histidine kinase/CheY-like chemotaxis protein